MSTTLNNEADILSRREVPLTPEGARDIHPRKDTWDEHFEWNGPEFRGKTPIGRVTVYVLEINLPHRVALRRFLMAEGVFPPTTAPATK